MNVYIWTSWDLKNAYIGEYRVPWANTIVYYPLEKDWNDYSWNWHNLTWTWTPAYTTSWWTKNVVSLNGSTGGKISNLSWTFTNYTINVWVKPTNNTTTFQFIFCNIRWLSNSVYGDQVYLDWNWTTYESASKCWFAIQYRPWWWDSSTMQKIYDSSNNYWKDTWYNLCFVATSSWCKFYVNNNLIWSNSTTGNIVLTAGKNTIWYQYLDHDNNSRRYFNGYMSEFIMENVNWGEEKRTAYYNQTKSNYWL